MPEENDGWEEFAAPAQDADDDPQWVNDEGGTEVEEPPIETGVEALDFYPSFDTKWRQAFEGLVYLGHLEAEVKIPYHHFTVRTLKTGEKIRVVELVKHLEDSIGYARAYRAAVVAAGLVLVDGEPLLAGSRKIDAITQKYQYVIESWYDFVIELLYDKINELEGNVLEILKELGVYNNKKEVAQADGAETAGPVQES